MNKRIKTVLWICLAVSLIAAFPGFKIRFSNEESNKSVVPVADYYDFLRSAYSAHIKFGDVLNSLKAAGVKTVAVRELKLGDLIYSGDIYVSKLGELFSSEKAAASGLSSKIRSAAGYANMNPASYVVVASDSTISSLLADGFSRRFEDGEISTFYVDNSTVFLFNIEIGDISEVSLGFDRNVLDTVKSAGMDILLRPAKSAGSNTKYLSEYEGIIKGYGVRYLIFDGSAVPGAPDNLKVFEDIINKNNLITGIIETPSQVRFVPQEGLDKLIKNTGYAVQRVYVTPEQDLQKIDYNEFFYRWIRCVVDRNIRIIYISPFMNPGYSSSENVNNTLKVSGEFIDYIGSKGYEVNGPMARLSADMPGKFHYVMLTLSLLFGTMLYLTYLTGIGGKSVLTLTVTGAVVGTALSALLGLHLAQYIALAASVLYPSLASLLIMVYLKKNSDRNGAVNYVLFPLLMFAVNLLGGYTIVSSLADIRYTMNIEIYMGVIISYTVPLLFFVLNYVSCFEGFEGIGGKVSGLLKRSITYSVAIFIAFLGIVLFVYIARSGNNMGLKAPQIEIKFREVLERLLVERPRGKEFLIGYPSLFVLVYLYKRYKKPVIALIFGLGTVFGCVSIVNSFCHVFTAICVSFRRGLNGLIIGSVIGIAAVGVASLFIRLYNRFAIKRGKNAI